MKTYIIGMDETSPCLFQGKDKNVCTLYGCVISCDGNLNDIPTGCPLIEILPTDIIK